MFVPCWRGLPHTGLRGDRDKDGGGRHSVGKSGQGSARRVVELNISVWGSCSGIAARGLSFCFTLVPRSGEGREPCGATRA